VEHLQQFCARSVLSLSMVKDRGWQLKQYAILANGRSFDNNIASSARTEALKRLPDAGSLIDGTGNHGVGFQIIHFTETGVMSPVFYWQWGNVLANIQPMRAKWETPTVFGDGMKEIVGCIWEMGIVSFEANAWKNTLLNNDGPPKERLATYLEQHFV